MDKHNFFVRFARFLYVNLFLRFSSQIRQQYLIRIDGVFVNELDNELLVSYHVANKRVNETTSVDKFVSDGMIYLIDPILTFEMGRQHGSYSEQLKLVKKNKISIKNKCVTNLKRVFIDE